MTKIIEVTKIVAADDTIKYEIRDNTGLRLLKNETVEAWVKFSNAESFNFSSEGLPESILALPITLYLMPVTWFYGVELVVPSRIRHFTMIFPQFMPLILKTTVLSRKSGVAR